MFKLREIQEQKSTELAKKLKAFRIGILAGEVRSGKTLTVLATADKLNKKHVLFVSKKRLCRPSNPILIWPDLITN